MSDIVTLKVAAPPEQVVLKVPAEPVATIIRVSEPGGTDTEYVDAGDARTLAEAKEYTDDHVVPVGYIDDGDEQTLLDAKGYADQVYMDLGTEIDSLTPTISRIDQTSSHNEYRILELKGQVDNLPAADVTKAYVDTGLSNKSDKSHQHDARDLISGVLPPARLGTGTANAASFLSGDGTFKIPPGTTNAQIESAVQAYLAVNPVAPSGNLIGPGRPDLPSGTGMAAAIAAATVGTTYSSTDGAGVGAWGWRKRTAGNNGVWIVFDGDTGWRNITALLDPTTGPIDRGAGGSYMKVRRTAEAVWMDCRFLKNGTGVIMFDVPDGWKHSSPDGAKGVLIPTDGGLNAGKMQYRGGGGFEWKPQNTGHGFGLFNYLSDRFWPTTLVEIPG